MDFPFENLIENLKDEVKKVWRSALGKITNTITQKGYLPFSYAENSRPSVVNTVLAVDNLLRSKLNVSNENIIQIIKEGFSFIKSELEKTSENIIEMDEDPIWLDIPGYPQVYTATYRKDLTIAYIFSHLMLDKNKLNFIKQNLGENLIQEMKNYTKKVLEKEIRKMNEEKQFWVEERRVGEDVPATSATCLFLATLGNYVYRGNRDER